MNGPVRAARLRGLPPALLITFGWLIALGGALGSAMWLELQGTFMLCLKALTFAKLAWSLPGTLRWAWWMHRLRRREVRHLLRSELKRHIQKNPDSRLLGEGFDWTEAEGEKAHALSEGPRPFLFPKGQSHWLHQIGPASATILQPLADTAGHTLVLGTTGAGKTRFFDLLVSEAILRGDPVILIDPKGDRDLADRARDTVKARSQTGTFHFFHPGHPALSVRLDPLRNFNRPSELAGRIGAALPGLGPSDPFRAFALRSLDQVIQGLLYLGERPSLATIRSIIELGATRLLHEALILYAERQAGPAWKTRVGGYSRSGVDKGSESLKRYYLERREEAPEPAIEGLLALEGHDRAHFGKMVASLLPALTALTSGPLRSLLSGDRTPVDEKRPLIDLGRAIERNDTVYLGLDALSDGPTAGLLGALLIADLAAVAGERYNEGTLGRPVHVFIDEASEVINEPTIQLLNKGRGAGFRLTLAAQTLADFSARLGSRDRALQVLGNVNSLVAFRVMDPETQRFVTEGLTPIHRRLFTQTQGQGTVSGDPSERSGQRGASQRRETADRFPATLLGQMPDLHYLARLAGGRLVKGRIPLLLD